MIDTLLEKIEANAGSDMCIVLGGYKPAMEQFFRNANNEGLKRRLNLGEAFMFEDFTDEQIKKVLKSQVVNAGLTCEPSTLDFAVKVISKKRMEDGFGNAGEAEQILTRAKLRISQRVSKDPSTNFKLLLEEDFAGEETSSLKAREAFAGLEHIEHIEAVLSKFEAMVATATEEGRKPHEEMANMHMLFLGPPGTGKVAFLTPPLFTIYIFSLSSSPLFSSFSPFYFLLISFPPLSPRIFFIRPLAPSASPSCSASLMFCQQINSSTPLRATSSTDTWAARAITRWTLCVVPRAVSSSSTRYGSDSFIFNFSPAALSPPISRHLLIYLFPSGFPPKKLS